MTRTANPDDSEIVSDLKAALEDTEKLLKDLAKEGGAISQSLRDRIGAKLGDVKAKLEETEALVSEQAKVAAKATDDYVRENPWQSIGVAAGVGFLIGLMVSRR